MSADLYAESLLAIDAQTGKLAWHFQGVHHGLWDYDFPAAPTLADITVDGKRIKAIAQISKAGLHVCVRSCDGQTRDIAWQVPHGDGPRNHPLLKDLNLPALGASSHTFLSSGGPLVTKSLLFVNQVQTRPDGPGYSTTEFFMRAFDKKTGAVVWEHRMNEPPYGTPMTYEFKDKQYVVVATGGAGVPARLQAFALP